MTPTPKKSFFRASELAPNWRQPIISLAQLHLADGDADLAIEEAQKILKVDVRPGDGLAKRDTCRIEISAKVIGSATPLNLVVPFSFGGGAA